MKQLKLRNTLMLLLLMLLLAITPFVKVIADSAGPLSGGGSGLTAIGAYSVLGNNTNSSAVPVGINGNIGSSIGNSTSGTQTLTINSPSVTYFNTALSGNIVVALPQASTCPDKTFTFVRALAAGGFTITPTCFAGDTFGNGASSIIMSAGNTANNQQSLTIRSTGVTTPAWIIVNPNVVPASAGGTGSVLGGGNSGGLVYASSASAFSAVGGATVAGQLWQSNGAAAPSATSTPGSGTALTSVTSASYIGTGNFIGHRTTVADIAYTTLSSDYIVAYTTLTAPRIVTLVATPSTGTMQIIKDEAGTAGIQNITVQPTSGTIDGATNLIVNSNYGALRVYYSGGNWFSW